MTKNQKKKILVIDDDQGVCDILEQQLQAQGFDTVVSDRGKTGILNAANQRVDLILLDIHLQGDLNGFITLDKLRRLNQTRNIPIIIISGEKETGDIERAVKMGANGYLIKPLDMDLVMKEIKSLIETPPPKRTGITLP